MTPKGFEPLTSAVVALAAIVPRPFRPIKEPTSGLEPPSCSSYEFACVHTSLSWCVRKVRLFRGFSVCQSQSCVHCVPVRIGPVAVKPFEQTRMADLISSWMIMEALQGYAPGMQVPDI